MALVVGVMVVGCFGRLQPDIHLNLVPGNDRCRVPGEYCHWAQGKICCGGLKCEGERGWGENRRCEPVSGCKQAGEGCALLSDPCCYPMICSATSQGECYTPGLALDDVCVLVWFVSEIITSALGTFVVLGFFSMC
ncbi:hypothetical protein G4B88_002206 [Cannabis sativa]|uniref:Uncharacterized protein n=1 Tax=Cannabis sativa TaxID=3483 RepID=A0A7J6G1G4_CANSA|nr:hypothetical protein G4B88_002206 [Cannabis sativa]